jgi:hypothetical protein
MNINCCVISVKRERKKNHEEHEVHEGGREEGIKRREQEEYDREKNHEEHEAHEGGREANGRIDRINGMDRIVEK